MSGHLSNKFSSRSIKPCVYPWPAGATRSPWSTGHYAGLAPARPRAGAFIQSRNWAIRNGYLVAPEGSCVTNSVSRAGDENCSQAGRRTKQRADAYRSSTLLAVLRNQGLPRAAFIYENLENLVGALWRILYAMCNFRKNIHPNQRRFLGTKRSW